MAQKIDFKLDGKQDGEGDRICLTRFKLNDLLRRTGTRRFVPDIFLSSHDQIAEGSVISIFKRTG
jgi:hypothetical protein